MNGSSEHVNQMIERLCELLHLGEQRGASELNDFRSEKNE